MNDLKRNSLVLALAVLSLVALVVWPSLHNRELRLAIAHGLVEIGVATAAWPILEGLAAAGDPRAQNNLGVLYIRGKGVIANRSRGRLFLSAAARQNYWPAVMNLAGLSGRGCGLDPGEAARVAKTLQPFVDSGNHLAASLQIDCLYFAKTQRTLRDRQARLVKATDAIADSGDTALMMKAGYTLFNLARTTPSYHLPGNEDHVRPLVRGAGKLFLEASEATALDGHLSIRMLLGQYGHLLDAGGLENRLREVLSDEWRDAAALRGNWAAACLKAQAAINRLAAQDGSYSRAEFGDVVEYARSFCLDRTDPRQHADAGWWYRANDYVIRLPRRVEVRRPRSLLEDVRRQLNGLLFKDADLRNRDTR